MPYSDDTLMPWGEHKGKRLGDVPPTHLNWLLSQPWIQQYKELFQYLHANRETIRMQAADAEKLKGDVDPPDEKIETYQDYLKSYRGF